MPASRVHDLDVGVDDADDDDASEQNDLDFDVDDADDASKQNDLDVSVDDADDDDASERSDLDVGVDDADVDDASEQSDLDVGVDDADDDDADHASEEDDADDERAVLEPSAHHVTKEDRTRVLVVTVCFRFAFVFALRRVAEASLSSVRSGARQLVDLLTHHRVIHRNVNSVETHVSY